MFIHLSNFQEKIRNLQGQKGKNVILTENEALGLKADIDKLQNLLSWQSAQIMNFSNQTSSNSIEIKMDGGNWSS